MVWLAMFHGSDRPYILLITKKFKYDKGQSATMMLIAMLAIVISFVEQ